MLIIMFIINADMECLLERIDTCHNNPKNYRGKDCTKHFSKDLKEHATKITNYEKKK